jgi:hypothetical protein
MGYLLFDLLLRGECPEAAYSSFYLLNVVVIRSAGLAFALARMLAPEIA